MKTFYLSLLCLFSVIGGVEAQISWPNQKRAAVVLTYDDGLPSQLQYVIPQLDKAGFPATFYLMGKMLKDVDIPAWREVSRKGHELGNHSVYHPCWAKPGAKRSEPCHALQCYSLKEMLLEIELMNAFLYAIDGKTERSYAYPCGKSVVGEEEIDYARPMLEAGLVKSARSVYGGVVNQVEEIRMEMAPVVVVNNMMKADALIPYVKEAIEKQGICVFLFHGVGDDFHYTIETEEHQKLIDFLVENKDKLWVDTFLNVMNHVADLKK
ncbi:MAG: polysaccharide deacetylase family protein [Parabacteroides sp.]|nr:polysaccharide deacetylase family protein [Parabacteroides sp.]